MKRPAPWWKGLAVLALCCLWSCGLAVQGVKKGVSGLRQSSLFHQGRFGPLSEEELEWAKIAWRYFENNHSEKTGLVNVMDRYSSTTMWCTGDYLAAMSSARQLGLIDKREFDRRLSSLLGFLNRMPLFQGRTPNRFYDTETGSMVGYDRQPGEAGWSAIDIGRLLVWLAAVSNRYPEYAEYIQRAILRWNFCDLLDCRGSLFGGSLVDGEVRLIQEGRLGYEEYAAHGFQAWGFDTAQASELAPYSTVRVQGVDLLHDSRDPRESGSFAPLVTLPFVLLGMEFNWDRVEGGGRLDSRHSAPELARLAEGIYKAQERRYEEERIHTARTDHPVSQPPFFVYDSLFAAGYPWNTMGESGESLPQLALVSTRAAFGLWSLWKTSYTDHLLEVVCALHDPSRGWYEGRYERTGAYDESISCSTNAVILEVLLYKKVGKLYRDPREERFLDVLLGDPFTHPGACFPDQRGCKS